MPAPSPRRKSLPIESLLTLRRRLDELPRRHADRLALIAEVALLYDVSPATVYRSLRDVHQPKVAGRRDRGQSRVLPTTQMERYCELVAALKLRTTNKKGRHLSTGRALELLEQYGVDTPTGFVQAPAGLLSRVTVDRYLRLWGLDQARLIRPPPAVRFQAEQSNEAGSSICRPPT